MEPEYDHIVKRFVDPIFIPEYDSYGDGSCQRWCPNGRSLICTAATGHEGLHAGWSSDGLLYGIWTITDAGGFIETWDMHAHGHKPADWEKIHPGCFTLTPEPELTAEEIIEHGLALQKLAAQLATETKR